MSELHDFSVAYYGGDRKIGALAMVECKNGQITVQRLETEPASDVVKALKPVLLGMTPENRAVLLDPKTKAIRLESRFPADAFPAHVYSDPNAPRDWFMNDGDKETGNDTLNCGGQGSSVTVIEHTNSPAARFLKTVCVGRGHHQCHFAYPSTQAPHVPHRTYVSNLKDGTVSVVGNDPRDPETYLHVVATINLCEADKEEGGHTGTPNNAFPHGLAYSPVTGKVYNLNNGYGTVAVIDPVTHAIESHIACKGYSNLFTAPGGRYLIARGADRKSDPQHVIGKLAVLDATTQTIVHKLELPDIYISKYYFNAEGTKLYLTTSSSGSPEQQQNIRGDVVLVLDLTVLPDLRVVREVKIGESGSLAFLNKEGRTHLVFSSCSVTGELVILDGATDAVITSVPVMAGGDQSRAWTLS